MLGLPLYPMAQPSESTVAASPERPATWPNDWPNDWPADPRWPVPADWPLLLAFPRSGSSWIRYCVEHFSGRRTPGRSVNDWTGAPIIGRSHDGRGRRDPEGGWRGAWRPIVDGDGAFVVPRLILLLRDPIAGLVGEAAGNRRALESYFANVRLFDAFPADKLLIYYEDLVANFDVMRRVLAFIGVSTDGIDFPLEEHRRRSALIYHVRRGSHTLANPLDLTYHRRSLTPGEVDAVLAHCGDRLGPDLSERYLLRYLDTPRV